MDFVYFYAYNFIAVEADEGLTWGNYTSFMGLNRGGIYHML